MKWLVIMLVMGQQYTIQDDINSGAKAFATKRACQEFVLSHPEYVAPFVINGRRSPLPSVLCVSEGSV